MNDGSFSQDEHRRTLGLQTFKATRGVLTPLYPVGHGGGFRCQRLEDYEPQGSDLWRDVELLEAQDLTPADLWTKIAAGRPALDDDPKPKLPRKRKTGNPPQRTIRGQVLKRPLIGDPPKPHA